MNDEEVVQVKVSPYLTLSSHLNDRSDCHAIQQRRLLYDCNVNRRREVGTIVSRSPPLPPLPPQTLEMYVELRIKLVTKDERGL